MVDVNCSIFRFKKKLVSKKGRKRKEKKKIQKGLVFVVVQTHGL